MSSETLDRKTLIDVFTGQLITLVWIARHLEAHKVVPDGSCARMLEEKLNCLPPRLNEP